MIHSSPAPLHNRPPQPWYAQPRIVIGGLFLLALLCYLALIPVPRSDGQLIGSDGVGYYVYLRSLLFDGNLDFTNEYAYYRDALHAPGTTPTGLPANKYAIGPALLWLPFFLVAHGVALLGQAVGLPIAADGYGYLYQAAISIGSIIYGALGFLLAYRCTVALFAAAAAAAAVALVWLAGNAIYYMVIEPSMAHMVSLFSTALLFSTWFVRFWRGEPPPLIWAAALGGAGGLVLLVRLQDGVFLPVVYGSLLVRMLLAMRAGAWLQARRWFWCGVVAGGCTLLVFTPQMLVWQQLYGTWRTSPYMDEQTAFSWLQPHLWGVLFSAYRGLFVWHPVLLGAVAGLLIVARRDRWLAGVLALLLALDVYIVASWWAWWQGDAFGGRMFLNATWIWVLGLAGLLEWLWRRRLRLVVVLVAALLLLWNGLALLQYRLGFIPMSGELTWQQVTIDRLLLPWLLLQRYVW
jgi:hypothetical protein